VTINLLQAAVTADLDQIIAGLQNGSDLAAKSARFVLLGEVEHGATATLLSLCKAIQKRDSERRVRDGN
jgi:erythromycin esterase-like protein